MRLLSRIAYILVLIGAINWGLIGLLKFDLIASLFGGMEGIISRILYTLVGISGIILIITGLREEKA